MSRGWQRSGLKIGEEVRINESMLVAGATAMERLESSTYIGESSTGLLIDCKFTPCIRTNNPENSHYKMFIPWASLWCGSVRLYREDSTQIEARRMTGRPTAYEVMKK